MQDKFRGGRRKGYNARRDAGERRKTNLVEPMLNSIYQHLTAPTARARAASRRTYIVKRGEEKRRMKKRLPKRRSSEVGN